MAAAMDLQTTLMEAPPAFIRRTISSGSVPPTFGSYTFSVGTAQTLPPTHIYSRELNMSRLFATLNSYRNLEANWDGYGGEPATYESMIDALEFLHSLPVRFPAPIPMLAGDGEISLFWEDNDRYLEASFPGDATYHYIFNAGDEKFASDDLPLNGRSMDDSFLTHIKRV